MLPPSFRPMPLKHGMGYTSSMEEPMMLLEGFRTETVDRRYNYHATATNWECPLAGSLPVGRIIDGFSPNLNKELHVGHLRNLAIARAIQSLHSSAYYGKMRGDNAIKPDEVRMVAMLGAAMGVKKAALEGWKYWTKFVGYCPEVYYDALLPEDVVPMRDARRGVDGEPDEVDFKGAVEGSCPKVWDGPNGPVIVKRTDGRSVYALHDLAFASEVGPTVYITGHEQREHFQMLGLGDRHYPMGLVLGEDGKKLKSRDGNALSAVEAVNLVKSKLRETAHPDHVAWNVLCWNFLHVGRAQDLKFNVDSWCNPDSPGMYITYTYARINKAIQQAKEDRRIAVASTPEPLSSRFSYDSTKALPMDYELMCLASQLDYWNCRVIQKIDPACFANHLHDLARRLGELYHKEQIVDGRAEYIYAVEYALHHLRIGMMRLGMFSIDSV